ncbi:tRNA modification GTPase [Algibacter luteus]|uniref:tRNA modification GTPase n=1 Tax=Algibacter luteus TaxID=1178825 RepID=UPI002597CB73|nr:tRNA modification GTPase [Algibacter luteus]WJJ98152.1 tRNA modification GTPase [Algibacter luteus]
MMKIKLLFLLTTILSFNCYSQISFENGYYIDNNNQKINCLIKNLDWEKNPTEFKYKLSENSELKENSIKSVKEFGIPNALKYVRSSVKIDRSSNKVDELDNERGPTFQEEELFLKVLVEGKSTLYTYVDIGLIRYFYSIDKSNIEQLIFKSYITPEYKIGTNNRFRNQLWDDLKCSDIKKNRVEKLKYRKSDLVNFFVAYNGCNNEKYINFEEKQKKDLFNLNIRPRLNISSFESNFSNSTIKNSLDFGFGLEAEFILPFNKNKWSFIVEPIYTSFTVEKSTNGGLEDVINYSTIECNAGVRYYFFLNDNSKFFINTSLIYDLRINESTNLTTIYMAYGLGYKYNDKYSIELRHQSPRRLGNDINVDSKTLSIIFGYSLF